MNDVHHAGAHTSLIGWLGALCALTVTLVKALYSATCVYKLLLTSKEWMALVAQFKGERATFATAGLKTIST